MKDIRQIEETCEGVKRDVEAVATGLRQLQSRYRLAAIPSSFDDAEKLLKKENFDVVVCGEVKQGKSSLINAMLGHSLLPTAVKETTSQVFRVSANPQTRYALIFDDGHRQTISQEDMVRYGTESGENLANDPLLRGRILRYIEVHTPATFLPSGLHLLDTPGLGALYSKHAEITHLHIAHADAVIFVKSGKDPIVDQERNFLKKIFGVTRNILFVQTKSDLFDETVREAMVQRNEELLNQEFSEHMGRKFRFWPVSSANLAMAATMPDQQTRDLLKRVSGFDAMMTALRLLFFRTTGYTGACATCQETFAYYQTIAGFINEQRRMLTATDLQEKQKLQKAKQDRLLAFQQQWGQSGRAFRAINEEVSTIITTGQQRAQGIFAAGGKIRKQFSSEIEELPCDLDAIKQYAATLSAEIGSAVSDQWREIGEDTQDKLMEVMQRFQMNVFQASTGADMDVSAGQPILEGPGGYTAFRDVFMGASMGATATGLAITLLSGPAGWAALAGAALFGWLARRESVNRAAISAKNQLLRYVTDTLNEIQSNFIYPDASGRKSKMQSFFDALRDHVRSACERITEQQKERMDDELQELERQANLNVEEAKKQLAKLDEMVHGITPLKDKLLSVRDALVKLNQELVF